MANIHEMSSAKFTKDIITLLDNSLKLDKLSRGYKESRSLQKLLIKLFPKTIQRIKNDAVEEAFHPFPQPNDIHLPIIKIKRKKFSLFGGVT